MSKKAIFFATLILFLVIQEVSSQTVYVQTSNSSIYRLNDDNSFSYLTTIDIGLTDIAISDTGDFYGVSSDGIHLLDITNGTYTTLSNTESISSASLTYGGSRNLYFIDTSASANSRALFKYNINTNVLEIVSDFDLNTPGDLSVYEGNIIFSNFFPSQNGNSGYSRIMAYNIMNGSLTEVSCLNDLLNVWGIANSFDSCGNNAITFSEGTNDFYSLDIESNTITDLNIDTSSLDGSIYGLASDNEYLASNCNTQLQSSNCNNLSIEELGLQGGAMVYPNPAKDIINIKSQVQIDQVEFYDLSGKIIKKINNPNGQIRISDLKTGIYMLKVYSGSSKETIKMLKK